MRPKSVLVTGANGHLGFRVLVSALKANYNVHATVRRPEAAQKVLNAASIQPYRSQLTLVIVEDILKDGAFDDAVQDMDYVLHIASPVSRPSDNYLEDFINPAVQGTLGLLRSAAKSPSVKRIVITSSMAVLDIQKPGKISGLDIGPIPPLDKLSSPFAGYVASKRIAMQSTNKFVEDHKPGFDVIHILPSVILGRNELSTTATDFASGTNRYVMNITLGIDAPAPMLGASVFVNDCAEVHVRALDDEVEGNRNFIATGGAIVWNEVSGIARKNFGLEIEENGLKLGGKLDTTPLDLDASETDEAFRVKWTPFETQVESVVGHYLEVVRDD